MSSSELPPFGEAGPLRPPDTDESTAANDSPQLSPELAMVDPAVGSEGQAPGELQKEVAMSSHAPSDGTFFVPQQDPVPAAAPVAPAPPVAPPAEPSQPAPVNGMRDVPLGTLIFRAGLLAEEQLEDALQEGMRSGKRLGEVLTERGLIRDSDLGRLLAGQQGLTFVELGGVAVDPAARERMPESIAKMQNALAFAFEDGVPVVAVADPTNELVLENVRRALGSEPKLVVAAQSDIARKLEEVYAAVAPTEQPAPAPAVPPVAPVAPVAPVGAPEPVAVEQQVPATPVPTPMPTVVPPPEERAADAQQPLVAAAPAAPQAPAEVPPLHAQAATGPALTPEPAQVQPPASPEPVQVQVALPAPEAPAMPEVSVAPEVATPEVPVAPAPEQGLFVQAAEQALTPQVEAQPGLPPAVEAPAANGHAPQAVPTHFVVLRLTDPDQIEIGGFAGQEAAEAFARTVVGRITRAEEQGEWPFFAERFLRPQSIVSVDVVEHRASTWSGSDSRSRWASPSGA